MTDKEISSYLNERLFAFIQLDETTREYEYKLTNLAKEIQLDKRYLHGDHKKIYTFLINSINETISTNSQYAFAVFYLLSIIARNHHDYSVWFSIYQQRKFSFDKHPILTHLINVFYLSKGIPDSMQDTIVDQAKKLAFEYSTNAGIVHCYADIVATIIEDNRSKGRFEYSNNRAMLYLDSAIEAVEDAIIIDGNYAKFYCTKGRLYAQKGDMELGKELIRHAIDKHDSSDREYQSKLQYYNYHLHNIQQLHILKLIDDQKGVLNKVKEQFSQETDAKVGIVQSQLDESLKDNTLKNIQIVVFFSGILGFILTGIQIAINMTYQEAQEIILIVFACFIGVFALFDLIIASHYKLKWWRFIISFSVVLFSLGIILYI